MIPKTSEEEWLAALASVPGWMPLATNLLVVSPHPDDEVLGAGGLIADRCKNRFNVTVLAVTDGEAAYPNISGLSEIRRIEQEDALAVLGVTKENILRLTLPDGAVASYEHLLTRIISSHIKQNVLVVAPWKFDCHPDHEACGRAAIKATKELGAALICYFFWAWHQSTPEAVPLSQCGRFRLDSSLQEKKASSLSAYRSQLENQNGSPVLSRLVIRPAQRSFETYAVSGHEH